MRIIVWPSATPRQETWMRWFAWYPVLGESKLGSTALLWLEEVECKEYLGYNRWFWRYREVA